jgi:hypothetical protein
MLELFVIGTAVVPMPGAEVSAEGAGKAKLVHVVTDRRAEQLIGTREE